MRRDRGGSGVGAVFVGVVQLFCAAGLGIRERARRVVLQQVDGIAFAEGKHLIGKFALVERHVVGVDLRFSRVRRREERISFHRRRGKDEMVLHAVNVHDEVFAVRFHRTRRLDGGGFVVVLVGDIHRFCIARGRADGAVHQGEPVSLAEDSSARRHRHVIDADLLLCQVLGGEELVAVRHIGGKVERVRRRIADGHFAVRRQRARGTDRGVSRFVRVDEVRFADVCEGAAGFFSAGRACRPC